MAVSDVVGDAAEAGPGAAVLEAENVVKAFGATPALAGASLSVRAGEIHVLLGENGSGKSTLAKIVAGIHQMDAGRILINGQQITIHDAHQSRELGVAIVFQELSLAPDLSVADNLFLGRENAAHPFAFVRRSEEARACREVLRRLDIDIALDRKVNTLSMARKQMLEVAKALLQQPVIMILDEPSSMLTEKEKAHLFEVIERLREDGVAILYVTHHLPEVAEIGDRVSVMRDGEVVVTLNVTEDLTEAHLLELLTGRSISAMVERVTPDAATPIVDIENVVMDGRREGVSLRVHPGEIVGLYGIVGCGREELGRALIGLTRPKSGSIRLRGRPYHPRSPAHALSLGVGYLPTDRKETGILPERTIRENLNLSNLHAFASVGFLSRQSERDPALRQLAELGVKYESSEHPIISLSGGNQQKVLFGRAVGRGPGLLVLEDPTAGIDMGAKLDLYQQMKAWAADGIAFLWLSSDLVETLTLCHRVYAMYDGHIVGEFVEPTLDDEEAMLAGVLGRGAAPQATAGSME